MDTDTKAYMISVETAKQLIQENVSTGNGEMIELNAAENSVLATNIVAETDLPPFNQSAMDGYAVGSFIDGSPHRSFRLVGELKAGDPSSIILNPGEAVRIFTGGMVPEGTMSVVMQEHVSTTDPNITVEREINPDSNIRPQGEQIKSGEIALRAGVRLNPAALGFLSSLGVTQVMVSRRPRIGLIITGNELVETGSELKPGQIYESNGITISSALKQAGFIVQEELKVPDNLDHTVEAIAALKKHCDFIIISGGISVGDYDFVEEALGQNEIETVFYKIKQKPGKPMLFGKSDSQYVFALPGNPASALTCCYEYLIPALRLYTGESRCFPTSVNLKLAQSFRKKTGRAVFLKARTEGDSVHILEGQSSAMLHTYAEANALVYLTAETDVVETGELVEVHLI